MQNSQFTPKGQKHSWVLLRSFLESLWCDGTPAWSPKAELQMVREALSVLAACTCFISLPAVDKGEGTEI